MDGFLTVPMSVETFEAPAPLVNSFKTMLDEFAGIGAEANTSANNAFLAELRKNNDLLMQFPTAEAQSSKIMEQLFSAC